MGRPLGVKNKGPQHIWSDEEKQYLAEITPGRHYHEILELMTAKFCYDYTINQISGAIKRYGLKTGFTGRFGATALKQVLQVGSRKVKNQLTRVQKA